MDDESILTEARKKKAPGERKKAGPPAPGKSITSAAQLKFWRRIAKGPRSLVRGGHSPAGWQKVRDYLKHQNKQLADKSDRDLVDTARKVLYGADPKLKGVPYGQEGAALPAYSMNKKAVKKRAKRRSGEFKPKHALREGLNEYMPVDDDFMDRLNKALGD